MFFFAHVKPIILGIVLTISLLISAASTSNGVIALLAGIAAVGTVVVAGITLFLSQKVHEVHVLVNARMTKVLELLGIAEDKITESRDTGKPVPPADDTHDLTQL
jgi:hypothetical protein